MKKTYSKPRIMFESFSMSTNIAAGCEKTFGLYSRGACGYEDDTGEVIYATGVGSVCTTNGGDAGSYDGLCYHLPDESNNLFNS